MNGKLYFDQEMAAADLQPFAGGVAAVYSRRCPGKDSANEDAAALLPCGPDAGILVVADGLGGLPSGEQAASVAIEALRESVERAQSEGQELRAAVMNGFEEANRKVQSLGLGAATTLAVVEVQGPLVRPYHVGDSMILTVGQRGKIKMQTISHSPVGYAVAAGVLDEDEAMHHEERHVVSNVIGSADMRIEVGPPLSLAKRDTLILATDGLFDNLLLNEIVERVRKGPLSGVAAGLAADSSARMNEHNEDEPCTPDDITFVAFRLK